MVNINRYFEVFYNKRIMIGFSWPKIKGDINEENPANSFKFFYNKGTDLFKITFGSQWYQFARKHVNDRIQIYEVSQENELDKKLIKEVQLTNMISDYWQEIK